MADYDYNVRHRNGTTGVLRVKDIPTLKEIGIDPSDTLIGKTVSRWIDPVESTIPNGRYTITDAIQQPWISVINEKVNNINFHKYIFMTQEFLDGLLIWEYSKTHHPDEITDIQQSGWTASKMNNDALPISNMTGLSDDSLVNNWKIYKDRDGKHIGTFQYIELAQRGGITHYIARIDYLERTGILGKILQTQGNGGITVDPNGTPRNVIRNGSDYFVWIGVIYSNQLV